MSGSYVDDLTDDFFGIEPDKPCSLSFHVKWKNGGDISAEENYLPEHTRQIAGYFDNRNWDEVKAQLKGNYTSAIRVTYFDSEDDEIPVDSQCEFKELIKYSKKRNYKGLKVVDWIVEKCSASEATDTTKNSEYLKKNDSVSFVKTASPLQQPQRAMAPMKLDNGVQQFGKTGLEFNYNGIQLEGSEDTAPKWFTNYMQTMKDEIVTEVSARVTNTVMDALNKKRENRYDSAASYLQSSDSAPTYFQSSDSEYHLDSNLDERISLAKQVSSSFSENRDKTSDACTPSLFYHYENSRRRYRRADKERKRHIKNHGFRTSNPDEIRHSPSFNRRRGEKTANNKREVDEARALSRNSGVSELISAAISAHGADAVVEEARGFSQNSGVSEQISVVINGCDARMVNERHDKVFDTPYRKMMASGTRQTCCTSAYSADCLEAPILQMRLASPYSGQSVGPETATEEKLRMGCSVTGQDLLERSSDRVGDYCALSDSDNISIISNVSHYSDMQRINNSFEMIVQPSSSMTELEIEDDRVLSVITKFPEAPQENDDPENTRDSSSFELLSEPPTSPLFIHMDEDHFATGDNETSNYNINVETIIDKRGNQSKIDKCPYAIDAHGKMYQRNIVDGGEECEEIVLEKRTGGAYSFVGESLPVSTKESMILTGTSVSSDQQPFTAAPNVFNDADVEEEATEELPTEPQTSGNCAHAFHESTQSFHSHIAQQMENDRQGIPPAESSASHVFVDHNASKGLGDTKRTSPKAQSSTDNKSHEDCRAERPRTSRKSTNGDTQGSGNRNTNSRHDQSGGFVNWTPTRKSVDEVILDSVDPIHILPRTLVTTAVDVASDVYVNVRRVYDRIRTDQTKQTADRSQSKFGQR